MTRSRRNATAAFAGLLSLVLFLFRSSVFGDEALFERDTTFWYYPLVEDIVRIVTSGAWPVWHPYRGFGEPLLANPSNQILYPPAYLHFLFEPLTAYTWYVVSHLLFSGMGVYWLARRLGVSYLGSFLASCAWVASGPLLSTVNMWNHFSGAAWIPWVILAARRACDSFAAKDALLWGVTIACQVMTGSPDASAMAALCSVGGVLDGLRWSSWRDPTNLRWLKTVALAWGFGAGLAAAQALPTLDLLAGSLRLELSLSARQAWSVHPLAMLQTAVPMHFKGLSRQPGDSTSIGEVKGPLLASLYLGVPVLGLAAAGALGPRRPGRVALVVLLVAVACIALGRHAPFFEWLVTLVPPLRIFRHPSKAMILAPFACALLAGMGVDALGRQDLSRQRSTALLVWCGALAALGAAAAGWALLVLEGRLAVPFSPEPAFVEGLRLAATDSALASLAGLLILGLVFQHRRRAFVARIAVALAVVELVSVTKRVNPTVPRQALSERPPTVSVLSSAGAARGARLFSWDYVQSVRGKQYPNFDVAQALSPPGISSLARALGYRMLYPAGGRWGLSGSYEPDVLGFRPSYLRTLETSVRAAEETPLFARLLQMGSVDYALAIHRESFADLLPLATVPSPFPRPIEVFRVPDPLPRVYAVGIGRLVGPDAGYRALADASFDFRRQVLLAGGPVQDNALFSGALRVREARPDRLRIETVFESPGYVVVTDAYSPGWRASIDGRPTLLQRANVGFRAVLVPAGTHVVEMTYRPASIVAGFAVSALAALVALATAAVRVRRG